MRDDFDPVVADRFKILDQVPIPDTWSRVLDDVVVPDTWSRSRTTEEVLNMVDLETAAPTDTSQKRPMRVLIAGIAAAAVLIAIVLVASRFGDDATPSDEPSPTVTVTVPSTVPPQALFGTPDVQLVPATYFVDEVDGYATPRISVTFGTGWTPDSGWGVRKNSVGFMTFSRPDRVFLDACHSSDGFHPGPMTTLDGLVAALSEQGGWAEVTALSDISVDGYTGKAFQRTAPAEFTGCSTSFAPFRSWENDNPDGLGWSYYLPGEVETLWVLDVNSTIIILNTRLWYDQTSAAAELAALLDSIRIEQA